MFVGEHHWLLQAPSLRKRIAISRCFTLFHPCFLSRRTHQRHPNTLHVCCQEAYTDERDFGAHCPISLTVDQTILSLWPCGLLLETGIDLYATPPSATTRRRELTNEAGFSGFAWRSRDTKQFRPRSDKPSKGNVSLYKADIKRLWCFLLICYWRRQKRQQTAICDVCRASVKAVTLTWSKIGQFIIAVEVTASIIFMCVLARSRK